MVNIYFDLCGQMKVKKKSNERTGWYTILKIKCIACVCVAFSALQWNRL